MISRSWLSLLKLGHRIASRKNSVRRQVHPLFVTNIFCNLCKQRVLGLVDLQCTDLEQQSLEEHNRSEALGQALKRPRVPCGARGALERLTDCEDQVLVGKEASPRATRGGGWAWFSQSQSPDWNLN